MNTRHATVIGGGIVGICCALHLQRQGFGVRLVERGEPGRAASFGNSGSFGTASCVPFALPGVLKRVPRMLLDPESPLKLRWNHVPRALPWFRRFVEASRPERVEAIAAARNSLLIQALAGYAPLIEAADAGRWVAHDGLMMTFESEAAFAAAAYALDLRRRNGVHMDILDGNEARQMEPALSPRIVRAVSLPDVSRTIDPFRLCEALAADFVRRGGEIASAEARGFAIGPEGPVRLLTDGAPIDVETVVIAAGVWSRSLAAQLGTHVPLEAERGYHVMFADPGFALRRAVVSADRSVSISHMHEGIRATGVSEIAAPDAPADMRIADRITRHARALLPDLGGEPASRWMGPRPSHPDSKPVIGRSPHHRNVFFAFGHDHLGLTMAGITGQLVAELATGRPTTVDLEPFRPDRF
ncbi:NAD(P)/FAD-dependent oxidoreductase [Reyranella sp.]|uniref:NAD(P)/FAD-dependent oxidoreductase n=1 Tax=Reyranella sp. TaxID=1929291 RepID=UPI003BABCCCB